MTEGWTATIIQSNQPRNVRVSVRLGQESCRSRESRPEMHNFDVIVVLVERSK